MILEFGAKNFYSFKEWFSISFKLGQQCPDKVSLGDDFAKILGVKGANASGKTNILKALSFLNDFCTNSFSLKPNEEVSIEPFFDIDEPSELYIEFKIDSILYRYEIELSKERVIRETIFRTKEREVKIIERTDNKFTTLIKEFQGLGIVKLRQNASIISTANQYSISELESLYSFFYQISTNVNMFGVYSSDVDKDKLTEFFKEHEEFFQFVKELVIKYDPDIKDIEIYDRELENGSKQYFPIFIYNVDVPDNFLLFHNQSSGTKTLYRQLARYKWVLEVGGMLVLDEFDIYLHPDILPDLLQMFLDPEINKNEAQIIFTTHNTDILDFLGKYRSYLVNKENCESYTYRLDEIPGDILRNDRSITPIYKSGKIGGVPKL